MFVITSAVAVKVGAVPDVVFRFLLDPKNLERTVPSNLDIEMIEIGTDLGGMSVRQAVERYVNGQVDPTAGPTGPGRH